MNNNLSKKAKTLIILGCVFTLLFVTVMVYYFGANYPEFAQASTKEFEIPGLETSFVPQGLDYDKANDKFVVCGYMNDGSASRFYIVDKETGEVDKYFTLTVELEDYVGHAGGIAISYPYAWVASEKNLYRFNYENGFLGANAQKLEVMDYAEVPNEASSVDIIDGNLVVGEFYREKSNPTDKSHHIEVEGGTNKALSLVYQIDQNKNVGLGKLLFGISTPNQVQGLAVNKEGKILLSTSYSIPSSKIYVYKNVFNSSYKTQLQVGSQGIDVYILDQTNLEKIIKAPSMSEEMVLANDKVYVLFESACKKYKIVNRTRTRNVYSLDI